MTNFQCPIVNCRQPRAGFTRTELLLVIGSSALLLFLILVGLPRIKQRMGRDDCAQNLAQIGVAMGQYAQDHEGKFPREWDNNREAAEASPDESSPTGAWCNRGFEAVLQPYLGNRRLFICPGDVWVNQNISTLGRRNNWDDTSYGVNILLANKPVANLADPANAILLGHTRFEHTLWEDHRSVLWDTHQTGNNYLFADGHVQFLSGPETLNPKNLWVPGKLR